MDWAAPSRYTTERMIETLGLLRTEYRFNGYIHAKAIPGADPGLTYQLGLLEVQAASYLAASARIVSLSITSTGLPSRQMD